MSDVAETEVKTAKVVHIPITKGKTTLAVNVDDIPDDVYTEVILQGLKVLLNRGTSKVTKEHYPKEAEMKAKANEVAAKQLEMVMTSQIKFTGGKAKADGKTPAKVMTEARRLAKIIVKEELKKLGIKPAHVEPKDITMYANQYLDSGSDASLLTIEQARKNIEERETLTIGEGIDLKSIAISDKLVAKAAKKKADAAKDKPLSAKQAGKVKARTKGEASHATH